MTHLTISTACQEIQDAVVAALTGDTDHMALLTAPGVYDSPPPTASTDMFPYEAIGALQENWADSFTEGMRSGMIQMDTWSRYHGRREAQNIQASQIMLLNRQPLSLATLHCVYITLDYNDVLQDPDGITWHGVTRYKWLVEATS